MEHKTFRNGADRFETGNPASETLQSEFESLFETNNIVDRFNRAQNENLVMWS